MVRVEHLLDAWKLIRVAGERVYGHFDHDAPHAVGPADLPDTPSLDLAVSDAEKSAGPYEVYEDPKTGEPLYRRRR